jgi:hypothetical protein
MEVHRVTDIDLINLSGKKLEFNEGDVVDFSDQRVLGTIEGFYSGHVKLPGISRERIQYLT